VSGAIGETGGVSQNERPVVLAPLIDVVPREERFAEKVKSAANVVKAATATISDNLISISPRS
jgi:hypothetical protein